ncbi:MAG: SRPBCC domain-containing protein [Bacteroidota bacterium]
MEKLTFKTEINAPREKVWTSLWEDKNYRDWTSVFAEGSKAETDWKKGSKVLFLDSKNDGMSSVIVENIPNQHMSIAHIGAVVKGVEYLDRPEDEVWRGAHENYTLTAAGPKTQLSVELESKGMDPKMLEYFEQAWPKALEKLKELAEKS